MNLINTNKNLNLYEQVNSNIKDILYKDAKEIFFAGLKAADSQLLIKEAMKLEDNILTITDIRGIVTSFDIDSFENIYVIGGGKSTAYMASALEEVLGDKITEGCINTRYGFGKSTKKIIVTEAGHPLPDNNGLMGAEKIAEIAIKATNKDLIISLFSGGASALIPLPDYGISLTDMEATTKQLLLCGATVWEINCIRKHLSSVKGGRLARLAYPATVISLIVSDVVADKLDTIGSGPTVPDETTFKNAVEIIKKYKLADKLPIKVLTHIRNGADGNILESPKPNSNVFTKVHNFIIGSNSSALSKMQVVADSLGYTVIMGSKFVEGEVGLRSRKQKIEIELLAEVSKSLNEKICVLAGGELTVVVKGTGKGGRNQEFALRTAVETESMKNFVLLAAGTDGNDGNTDDAGGIISGDTITKAKYDNLNAQEFLENNDSNTFLNLSGNIIKTGPTNTNIMDLKVLLIDNRATI